MLAGADGKSGTQDDLRAKDLQLAKGCWVAHGNLEQWMKLPPKAKVLATARFGNKDRAVLAEYLLRSLMAYVLRPQRSSN